MNIWGWIQAAASVAQAIATVCVTVVVWREVRNMKRGR